MSGRKQVRVHGLTVAAAIGFALTAMPAWAATEVAPPNDPVEKAAFDVLDKHCARCHQDGKLTSRERPAKNFGNILKLDEIASNPNYILPGNPFGSKLFKQITDKEMPYDVNYEGDSRYSNVSEDELKSLETWIQQLGTKSAAACEARKFVNHEDIIGLMASDLDKQPRARKKGTRYLTLTHLKNACAGDDAMKVFRQGAIKLVNSLSRSSDVVRLETVDPDETVIRINIDDLGWEASDWDIVLATYPYNTQPETELTSVLKSATGTQMPYVRADWFAFAASQPPLYDKLLKLPKTFQALAKEQGVDVEGNIRKFIAQRSGFQKSGVSQNNRLIERHPSRSGYFWTSYDFAGNKARQSLFENPLGPTGRNAFQHDGGETIYSLPNGFQAYYLNTAKGDQLDKGPTTIVRDLSRKDLAVTNGISCMGCHDQGMRKAKDDIRNVVLAGRSFPKDVRDQVEALYPPTEKMDQLIENDGKRFADAMFRAGLEPTLKLNGVEMINALAKRYEDDVDINLAAAEFGMTKDEFKSASGDADRKFKALIRRLEQGSVPRDQFEATYRDLAKSITDDEEVTIAAAAAAGIKAAAKPAAGIGAELSLISDRDSYTQGDTPVFTVVSTKDCFLTLSNLDEKGTLTVLLPNKFQQNNRVKAGQEVQFPGPRAPFQYRMADKGVETVIATCSEGSNVDGIKHDFGKANLTTVQNYTRSLARAIAVEGKPLAVDVKKSGGAPVSVQTAKAPPAKREVSRAAIRIDVR
ncbi:MAG: DUF4384 domain-containing protein [Pseudorhodoplanes sp.]|jgi:hypothetical protein|nr:DUF4384 domain-containing protein [Pseudorhodoplanes sp.]